MTYRVFAHAKEGMPLGQVQHKIDATGRHERMAIVRIKIKRTLEVADFRAKAKHVELDLPHPVNTDLSAGPFPFERLPMILGQSHTLKLGKAVAELSSLRETDDWPGKVYVLDLLEFESASQHSPTQRNSLNILHRRAVGGDFPQPQQKQLHLRPHRKGFRRAESHPMSWRSSLLVDNRPVQVRRGEMQPTNEHDVVEAILA